MSNTTDTALSPRIVPEEFFYSIFRNATNHVLYVWWAGSHGLNIEPGAYFKVEGDPRIPQPLPRSHTRVQSIKQMLEEGLIEFCSSPPPILDDHIPNGRSMTLVGNSGNPAIGQVPLERSEVEARVLPVIAPALSLAESGNLITVDWSSCENLEPQDKFSVVVTPPDGAPVIVRTAHDRVFQYAPQAGYGEYKFAVMVHSIDDRIQEGVQTIFEYEEPTEAPPT
jgi:hypothetical protein